MIIMRRGTSGTGVGGRESDKADGMDLLRCVHRPIRCGSPLG